MEKTPRVSVIMIDGSFRESFHAIDFFCNQTLRPDEYELIWVEYTDAVSPELQAQIDKYTHARIIMLGRSGLYHSSYCFNAGIMAARADLVVIPDADVVVEPDFLESVWHEHQALDKLAMYIHRLDEPEAAHKTPANLGHLKNVCEIRSPGNFGGCLTVRKKWLLVINGYEQHPVFASGFHGNGFDINMRFRSLGLYILWHPTLRLYHPWHPFTASTSAKTLAKKQNAVSRYRTHHLLTDAFEGIDPARNTPLPEDLAERLERIDEQQTGEQVHTKPVRAESRVRRLSRKIKGTRRNDIRG
ncbi:MAG: glycosyltransferase family 2 protein [Anaerolineae bacterium]|nr:glycosyltransferase family 2 protein [Anaerolineae bacterium]